LLPQIFETFIHVRRTQSELKASRESYQHEKGRLLAEVDELKKSKIDLQVELGHLLRDKRRTEIDLETVQKVSTFQNLWKL
jgi:hypothetical protein